MDTCIRNLSFVHHLAALSPLENRADLTEKGRFRGGLQVDSHEEELLCPKPRRMALSCCAPDFIRPVCPWQSSSRTAECDAGYEILEIFLNKGACVDGEILNFGCSPPYCSPPTRASNPIVHDIQFCNQRSCSPASFVKPKTMTMPSFSSIPSVRIEGFDTRRDVHASA